MRRLRGSENNLEVTVASTIEIALSAPPIECLLIMRPGGAPVELVTTRPEKIAERFVSFGPDRIAIDIFVSGAYQLFELLLRLLERCVIGGLCGSLRTPRSIGEAKLNPARIARTQLALVDFCVQLVGSGV